MSNSISVELYYKLKNEYHQFKQQSEEIQKDLNKTLKQSKETIELLKKENAKLKSQNFNNNYLNKNQIIQKLKEEKLLLSKKIIELENEKNLHKCNILSNEKSMRRFKTQNLISTGTNFIITSFSFSFYNIKTSNIIKESLKKKNEEILVLKNELMKKEQIIQKLKIKNSIIYDNEIDNNEKKEINNKNNNKLFRTKSDNHFFISNISSFLTTEKNNNQFQHNKNISKFYHKKGLDELNLTLSNEEEEDAYLEKNIQIELKNILEEKKNFILKTLTSENFSFDIFSNLTNNNNKKKEMKMLKKNDIIKSTPKKNNIIASNNYTNYNNSNINIEEITDNIDKMLEMINRRKKDIEQERKYLEELKEQYE